MTLLIATDEAGYGPRLGPLVVVATAWRIDDSGSDRLGESIEIPGRGPIRVDDSKRLFRQPRPHTQGDAIWGPLDLITAAAARWVDYPSPMTAYRQWLGRIAPDDLTELPRQPWFALLSGDQSDRQRKARGDGSVESHELPWSTADLDTLVQHWSGGEVVLVGIAARVIDAARFNERLRCDGNKADLLSGTTCELALRLAECHREVSGGTIRICSDRHGGRAHYGGLLQHHCPDHVLAVVSETSRLSRYQLTPVAASGDDSIDWSFTVGGDSYAPVAMSSIIAKATRERLMSMFNAYFRRLTARFDTRLGRQSPTLRPTAGYAGDATRFLNDTASIRRLAGIDDRLLIRSK